MRERRLIMQQLVELGLAGLTPNTPEANLRSIRQLLDGNVFYTFGIEAVRRALATQALDEEGILDLMAWHCGQANGRDFLAQPGTIAPDRALAGLEAGAAAMRHVIARAGRVAFGTGHPGSMLNAYNRLADYLEQRGCHVVTAPPGATVGVDWVLDFVGRVAVTSDTCGVLHGHSTRPMERFLAACPDPVDLVIADHGHAGAAINAGLATIAVMDTNDPALAVAAHLEIDNLVVIPLFDNRPNAVTARLADLWIELIEHGSEPAVPRRAASLAEAASRRYDGDVTPRRSHDGKNDAQRLRPRS